MAKAPFVSDPALIALAVDYSGINARRRGYIADQVAPLVRVETAEFRYPVFDLEDVFNVVDNQVDRLGRLNEIYSKAGEATGATLDYGLSHPVPYRDEAMASAQRLPWNLKSRALKKVVDKNQLAREVRVAALIQTAANYGTQTEDEVGTPWTGAIDVGAIIEDRGNNMLLPPNTAVMSRAVKTALARQPSLAASLGGDFTKGKKLTDEELALALGVDKIIVGNTLKQTSKRGQTVATGQIWGNHFALLHIPDTAQDGFVDDVDVPAFALTFQWGDEVSGEVADPEMGLWGGVRVRSGKSLLEKIVAPFGGYLFRNVLG